jgi:hypothetical protein
MAVRPVFVPQSGRPRVRELAVDFEWFPGFAVSQQQKCIAGLHRGALRYGVRRLLTASES